MLAGATFRAEAPNDKVNDFMGQLCLRGQEPALLSRDNMLLRGCQLRNTEWVLGLVVTCGTHTKICFSAAAYESSRASSSWRTKAWRSLVKLFGGTGPKPKMGTTSKMVNVASWASSSGSSSSA